MATETKEIKELKSEIQNLVDGYQQKFEELKADGEEKNSATLAAMEEKFGELSAKYDKSVKALEAETKAREDLELAMATAPRGGDSDAQVKSNPEYLKGFKNYIRKGVGIADDTVEQEIKNIIGIDDTLSAADMSELKTLLVGSGPDGGYVAPAEMSSTIIKRMFETSPMRSLATVVTTGAESLEYVLDDGEFSAGWVREVDARSQTDASKLGIIKIPTHELYAMPKTTQKFLDDTPLNAEQWLQGKIANKLGRVENTAFVSGDGIDQPRGILDYDDWTTAAQYERNALETRTIATPGTYSGDDLIDLQSDLLEAYQMNATWGMHRKRWSETMKLKDSQNQYLLNPAMMFTGSLGMQLLGKPVSIFGDMHAGSDNGEVIVVYGDFREGYVITDRIGIRVIRDIYTKKGFVLFYTTKRTGGAVVNFQAIKRLKYATA